MVRRQQLDISNRGLKYIQEFVLFNEEFPKLTNLCLSRNGFRCLNGLGPLNNLSTLVLDENADLFHEHRKSGKTNDLESPLECLAALQNLEVIVLSVSLTHIAQQTPDFIYERI